MAGWSGPIVADFEGLDTPNDDPDDIIESYGFFSQHAGLSWYCPEASGGDYQACVYVPNGSDNGYTYGVTSGEQAFFSPWASSVEISLDGGGLWNMESVWINAAWDDALTVVFQGFRSGAVVAESEHVLSHWSIVELITFGGGFHDIDTLTVSSQGGHFTMDDFTYSVPAPGAIAVLGLAGLAAQRRRRRSP
jgi:hypothetical protein